jgi:hypothetical protein
MQGQAYISKLYTEYVRPHFEYVVASWSPWSKGDKKILEKVQKRAMNMASKFKSNDYENKISEARMNTLEQRLSCTES